MAQKPNGTKKKGTKKSQKKSAAAKAPTQQAHVNKKSKKDATARKEPTRFSKRIRNLKEGKTESPITEGPDIDLTEVLDELRTVHNSLNEIGGCPCLTLGAARTLIQATGIPRSKDRRDVAAVLRALRSLQLAVNVAAVDIGGAEGCHCLDGGGGDAEDPVADQAQKEQSLDKTTRPQQPSTDTKNKYPEFEESQLDPKTACAHLKKLRRYWNFSFAVDTERWLSADDFAWMELETVRAAINAVTEAIHREGGEHFALWSDSAYNNWARSAESQHITAARTEPAKRLLFPVWFSCDEDAGTVDLARSEEDVGEFGHTVLAEFDPGVPDIGIFDSMPSFLPTTLRPKFNEKLVKLARQIGLCGESTQISVERYEAAQQSDGANTCSLHTILNGWARAMHFSLRETFNPSLQFYREALHLVNLALAGYLDSATIYAFFMCHKFVDPGKYATMKRHFMNTWGARGGADSFEDIRNFEVNGEEPLSKDRSRPARRPSEESTGSNPDEYPPLHSVVPERQWEHLVRVARNIDQEDVPALVRLLNTGEIQRRMQARHPIARHKRHKRGLP